MRSRNLLLLIFLILGCDEVTIPKPTGYIRADLPTSTYETIDVNCPFIFKKSSEATLDIRPDNPCWMNIRYPALKADIHITYKTIQNNLREYIEETRKLAYDHQFRANNIRTEQINLEDKRIHGVCYYLDGEVASNTQFFVTDSLQHFIRGSLYFNSRTNSDSLKPYLDFINNDIGHLIRSMTWQ